MDNEALTISARRASIACAIPLALSAAEGGVWGGREAQPREGRERENGDAGGEGRVWRGGELTSECRRRSWGRTQPFKKSGCEQAASELGPRRAIHSGGGCVGSCGGGGGAASLWRPGTSSLSSDSLAIELAAVWLLAPPRGREKAAKSQVKKQ